MTLLFMDGFDHYTGNAELARKWGVSEGMFFDSTYGRFGGQGIASFNATADYAIKDLDSTAQTLIVGFAFKIASSLAPTDSTSGYMFDIFESRTSQIKIRISGDRTIQILNGGSNTIIGESTNRIIGSTWYYFELKVTISNTVGVIIVNMNGVEWINETSVDTQNTSNAYADGFRLRTTNINHQTYYDDLYVCDNQGTTNNDFLGDVKVVALHPDGAGNHTDFTPSTGSNYENVDDPTDIDDDTTYNSSGTATDKDSYALSASPTDIDTVYGVQLNTTMRKDDAGTREAKPFVRTNSTDYSQGSNISVSDSYTSTSNIVETNPDDSAAWEKADLDGLEIGLEIIS